MKRQKPQKQVIGIGAWIKRDLDGAKWERVGFLFNNHAEAGLYARNEYPNAKAYRVSAIRLYVTPRMPGTSWADKPAGTNAETQAQA